MKIEDIVQKYTEEQEKELFDLRNNVIPYHQCELDKANARIIELASDNQETKNIISLSKMNVV
jgi:hypothetical protein